MLKSSTALMKRKTGKWKIFLLKHIGEVIAFGKVITERENIKS